MLMPVLALIGGIAALVWSADRFVEGAVGTARHLGMSTLLIGMVVIGFGTSAPEMLVSALAASQGSPGIALGNAYGSNITNIGLILGCTALLRPISVHSQIIRKELPILLGITALAAWQLRDGELSGADAWTLLAVFALLMAWSIQQGLRGAGDTLGTEMERELSSTLPLRQAVLWLIVGLFVLIASSRLLVWGAVAIATEFGVSDLLIGLTIVAIGTSLPELASSIAAARKGEHDLALGNILGSNLFNTLAVVGIAGAIHPMAVPAVVLSRDVAVMAAMTVAILFFGFRLRGTGSINRFEGLALLLAYVAYNVYLIRGAIGS